MGVSIHLASVSKTFGPHMVLKNIDLNITGGRCLGLLGASGSGKTTLLRLVAGLEQVDGGEIRIDDAIMDNGSSYTQPHLRHVGLVFQDLALWPHLTARQHLDLVARSRDSSRAERRAQVGGWLDRMHLTPHANRRPDQLSGGEQQRLALARTLVPGPRILLLDEPFAGCDRPLAEEMKSLVREFHGALGLTTILVSHDWRDMEGLVEGLAVLEGGCIMVHGAPEKVQAEVQGKPLEQFFR
jgi:iron(III) transport system ATP-binding protein